MTDAQTLPPKPDWLGSLISDDEWEALLDQGHAHLAGDDDDGRELRPLVKWRDITGDGRWLLFGIHPKRPNVAFVIGHLYATEYGTLDMADLIAATERVHGYCTIRRSPDWRPDKPWHAYLNDRTWLRDTDDEGADTLSSVISRMMERPA